MKRIIYYLLSAILLYSCTGQETPDGYGLLQVSSFGIETQADVQPLKRSADSRLQVDIARVRPWYGHIPQVHLNWTLPSRYL